MIHAQLGYFLSHLLQDSAQPPTDKALEAAISFSQSLSQWAYIVIGGSVALLFKDIKSRSIRHSFWVFIPGWLCLSYSIYRGMEVQEVYIGYLMNPNRQRDWTILSFNNHVYKQMLCMEIGLGLFAVWLIVFLVNWILSKDKPTHLNEDR